MTKYALVLDTYDSLGKMPDGTVYVTWDYGPSRTSLSYYCPRLGSCTFTSGDLNVVLQKSTDGGKTWSAMSDISPGFPNSGADSAPLVVEPSGRIDVLYQGYQVSNPPTDTLGTGNSYFTSSTDGGRTWSAPVKVGGQAGTMLTLEWWIDGDISIDSAGNLYATWDTQGTNPDGSANDIGWLSYSTDGGVTWSAPVQAPADQLNVPHITEVAGAWPRNRLRGVAVAEQLARVRAVPARVLDHGRGGCRRRCRSRPRSAIPRCGQATRSGSRPCLRRAWC